jgi:protein-tyrosine kinase
VSLVEKAVAKLKSSASQADAVQPAPADRQLTSSAREVAAKPRRPATPPVDPSKVVALARALSGFLPDLTQERRISHEYRRVKRPLLDRITRLHEEFVGGARLLMVASALPGDGKTFSSFHLAQSIARERDVSALLVDADVARPALSRALGIADRPGLLDALADENLDVESCVLPTDMPGLSLLPAGRGLEMATELLASNRMHEILERLSTADPYRIVVFDSPPLLMSSESRVLAQHAGQVVLVVLAGVTPQGAVKEAMATIPEGKLTGVILNERDTTGTASKYGYGTYGDYGYTEDAERA